MSFSNGITAEGNIHNSRIDRTGQGERMSRLKTIIADIRDFLPQTLRAAFLLLRDWLHRRLQGKRAG